MTRSMLPALALALACPSGSAVAETKKILICTDLSMGMSCVNVFGGEAEPADVDDAWAIAFALTNPAFEVVGVVVSFGNCVCEPMETGCDPAKGGPQDLPCATIDEQMVIGRWLLDAYGSDAPLYRGASSRFSADLAAPAGTSDAIEMIRGLEGGVTVVGIGPATDPAFIVRDLAATGDVGRLDELVLEMGQFGKWEDEVGFSIGTQTVSDFNFRTDPLSVRWLCEEAGADLPETTFVPFNAIRFGYVTEPGLGMLAAGGGEIASEVASECRNWLNFWTEKFDEPGFHLWDFVCLLATTDGVTFIEEKVEPRVICIDDKPALRLLPVDRSRFTSAWNLSGFEPPIVERAIVFASPRETESESDQNGVVQLGFKSWFEAPAPENCPGDLNHDGVVDGADLGLLIDDWGICFRGLKPVADPTGR